MGDVHGERGLAHPAHAGHPHHRHGRAISGQVGAHGPAEHVPAGVVGDVGGQLRRREPGGTGRPDPCAAGRHRQHGRRGQLRIARQYSLMELAQAWPRVDAQLLHERATAVGEHPQRLGLPSAAPQRQHQQLPHRLQQGMLVHPDGQLTDDTCVPPRLQLRRQPRLDGSQSPFDQPGPMRLGEGPRQPGQRLAVPQLARLLEQLDRTGGVTQGAGPACRRDPGLEHFDVHGFRGQPQHVAAARGHQNRRMRPVRLQHAPQPRDVGAHDGDGAGRRLFPQGVDELVDGDDPARPERQRSKHRPLLGGTEIELGLSQPGLHRPEQAEAQLSPATRGRRTVGLSDARHRQTEAQPDGPQPDGPQLRARRIPVTDGGVVSVTCPRAFDLPHAGTRGTGCTTRIVLPRCRHCKLRPSERARTTLGGTTGRVPSIFC